MAQNGYQHDGTIEDNNEVETPTKQPRSSNEMPGYHLNEPNSEVAEADGRAASDRCTSHSTPRHRHDSVKKTRPRRC